MIQLPDDVRQIGLKRSAKNKFEHAAIYWSAEKNFSGTEEEFVAAGHAYRYQQIDDYTRMVIK